MPKQLSSKQFVQESEYSIPYHYIPCLDSEGFSQTRHWSWGMRYMAGIELVISELRRTKFSFLIDAGCGDGRFLNTIRSTFPKIRMLGIDYSENAIAFAKALNPHIEFKCADISDDDCGVKSDVITLIEVLEHIPVEKVACFLGGVAKMLLPNGKLILTVPHVNKRVQSKHYQHFSNDSLSRVLTPLFKVEKLMPFDKISRPNSMLIRLLGYTGQNYLITNKKVNAFVYNRILSGCLNRQLENKCGRLLAVSTIRS